MIRSARQVKWIYDELGVNLDTVGCIMAKTSSPELNLPDYWLYYTENPDRFWIDGEVEDSHITLKYGILPGVTRQHVDAVLDGWQLTDVHKREVIVFDSPYEDEPYKCIVLAMESESLRDANSLLSMLPSISTFRDYVSHLTLAYVHENYVDEALAFCKSAIAGYQPQFLGLDYGDQIK